MNKKQGGKKDFRDYVKWAALAVAILNPIGDHLAAQNYLIRMSSPPPHPTEPLLAQYLWLIELVTIALGLISLPRWQGILSLIIVPVSAFLWGYGL